MRQVFGLLFVCLAVLVPVAPAAATWSVVGVDPSTNQVGVAVASCVPIGALDLSNGFELIALAPGRGAGVSQALYNNDARERIEELIVAGEDAADVVSAVIDPRFDADADDRQHAVVLLNGDSDAFTGIRNSAVAYDRQSENVSVQGNILVAVAVVDDAIDAFDRSPDRDLGDRLVDALEAGSLAGGDSRCGDQTALFAHISVIDEDGERAAPNVVNLTTIVTQGDGQNPVALLAQSYREGERLAPADDNSKSPGFFVAVAIGIAVVVALSTALKSRGGIGATD